MTTIPQGATGTYTFNTNEYVNLTLSVGSQANVLIKTAGGVTEYGATTYTSRSIGPFNANDVLAITAIRGSVDYAISTYTPAPQGGGISTLVSASDYTSVIAAPLATKLSKALPWDPVSNTSPHLASGVKTGDGSFYATQAATLTTAIDGNTAVGKNDWFVFNDTTSVWQQYSALPLIAQAPDALTFDFTQNTSVAAILALVQANTAAIAGLHAATPSSFSLIWDAMNAKDMGDYTVVGATAFTSNTSSSVVGGFTQGTVIADGTNLPTFDGSTPANYVNTAGARNRVKFERVGNSYFWSCGSTVGFAAVKGARALPVIASMPTLLASWDFGDVSKLTMASGSAGQGGQISAVAGADGTTFTLAQATSANQPTSVVRNNQICASFTSGQFLQLLNALNLNNTGYTIAIEYEPRTETASQGILDVGAAAKTSTQSRISMIASMTTGYTFRKYTSGAVLSSAQSSASTYTAGIHCLIGRAAVGVSACKINVDGIGTAVVAGATASAAAYDRVTVGGTWENSALANAMDGWVTRIAIWNSDATDAQVEALAADWATGYGSANAA